MNGVVRRSINYPLLGESQIVFKGSREEIREASYLLHRVFELSVLKVGHGNSHK